METIISAAITFTFHFGTISISSISSISSFFTFHFGTISITPFLQVLQPFYSLHSTLVLFLLHTLRFIRPTPTLYIPLWYYFYKRPQSGDNKNKNLYIPLWFYFYPSPRISLPLHNHFLHSTLVLFLFVHKVLFTRNNIVLHSTLVLFLFVIDEEPTIKGDSTFHFGSISMLLQAVPSIPQPYLHSTLVLFL